MTKKFKIENEAYDYFYEQIKDTHKYLGLLLNRETMLYEVRTSPPKKGYNYSVIKIHGTV